MDCLRVLKFAHCCLSFFVSTFFFFVSLHSYRYCICNEMLIECRSMVVIEHFKKVYLFYNDYETSYTTYINHVRWHRCLRSSGLGVGGNRSARRKPICLTW